MSHATTTTYLSTSQDHTNRILSRTLKNSNVSEEAKDSAEERLNDMSSEGSDDSGKNPNNVARGLKA